MEGSRVRSTREGSYKVLQLWALRRAADPGTLAKEAGDGWFISSSAVAISAGGNEPKEMQEEQIWGYMEDYAEIARNAIAAGFDGVEIHAANGFLVDQSIQDICNKVSDGWGGSIAKRSRFGLEIAQAVVDAVGVDRVGIRLSPFRMFQGMKMIHQYRNLAT